MSKLKLDEIKTLPHKLDRNIKLSDKTIVTMPEGPLGDYLIKYYNGVKTQFLTSCERLSTRISKAETPEDKLWEAVIQSSISSHDRCEFMSIESLLSNYNFEVEHGPWEEQQGAKPSKLLDVTAKNDVEITNNTENVE